MRPRGVPPRRGLLAAWLLVPVLGAAGFQGQEGAAPLLRTPAPAVPIRHGSETPRSACAECHREVAEEWAATAHGLAWLDEEYHAALKTKKRPELCHGCHAPEDLPAGLLSAKPDTRAEEREQGVRCETCHRDQAGTMLGLHGTPTDAHPSKAAELLAVPGSNELCSTCHATNVGPVIGVAKDFASAGMAARGLSCVGCHMTPVERAWAEGAPVREGRSHALQTPRDPAFLRLAFGLELVTEKGRSAVRIRNQAGHRVPGLIGRTLTFQAELRDAAGAVLEQRELVIDERAYLPVDGAIDIGFTRAGASAHVRATHAEPRASAPVGFLDETLPSR